MIAEHQGPTPETQERISSRRRDLYDVMQRLEASAARPSGAEGWRQQLDDSLSALDKSLRRHTAEIEAEQGLFEEVAVRSPNLIPLVNDLRREHVDMSASCSDARGLVARSETPSSVIRAAIIDLLGRLVIHRQRGAELLYDSYNLELAAGD